MSVSSERELSSRKEKVVSLTKSTTFKSSFNCAEWRGGGYGGGGGGGNPKHTASDKPIN